MAIKKTIKSTSAKRKAETVFLAKPQEPGSVRKQFIDSINRSTGQKKMEVAPSNKWAVQKKGGADKISGTIVTVGTSPDGYKVYGSALAPKHRSAARIASAVTKAG